MAVGKYRDPGLRVFGDDYPTPDGSEYGKGARFVQLLS
jgi:UDP-glucose 4-epimerase